MEKNKNNTQQQKMMLTDLMATLGVHDWNDKQEILLKVFKSLSPVDLQYQRTTRSKLDPFQQLESFFGGQIYEDTIDNLKTCYDGECTSKVDTLVILSKAWGNLKESLIKEEANIESIYITSPHGRRQRSLTPKRATRRSARNNDTALVAEKTLADRRHEESLRLYIKTSELLYENSLLSIVPLTDFMVKTYSDVTESVGSLQKLRTTYKIVGSLSSGNFGSVHKAVCAESGNTVAVKEFKSHKDQSLEDIGNEIMLLQSMPHPKVPAVFNSQVAPHHQFLVMTYYEGKSLEDYIGNSNSNERLEQAPDVLRCLLVTLFLLMQKSVCHRDIKPANIFLEDEKDPSSCVIGDYGLGRLNSSFCRTEAGTFEYMTPEIAEAGPDEKYDGSMADEFSTGRTIINFLVGNEEFKALRANRFAATAVKNSLKQLCVPDGGIDLLLQMTASNPLDRPHLYEVFVHPWLSAVPDPFESKELELHVWTLQRAKQDWENQKKIKSLEAQHAVLSQLRFDLQREQEEAAMWKLRHDVVTGDLIDKKTFTSDSKRWGAFFCLSKYISSTWYSCRADKSGFPGLADFLAKAVGVIEEKKSIDKITEQLKPDKFEPKEKKRWQKEAKDAINEISNSVQTDLKPAEHYGVV